MSVHFSISCFYFEWNIITIIGESPHSEAYPHFQKPCVKKFSFTFIEIAYRAILYALECQLLFDMGDLLKSVVSRLRFPSLNNYYTREIQTVIFFQYLSLPNDIASLLHYTISIVHYTRWLVVDNFSIFISLPCYVIFFEWWIPVG